MVFLFSILNQSTSLGLLPFLPSSLLVLSGRGFFPLALRIKLWAREKLITLGDSQSGLPESQVVFAIVTEKVRLLPLAS